MSQIHPETQSDDYHRPSGLLSRSLQTLNKTKLFLIQLSFIVSYIDKVQIYTVKTTSHSAIKLLSSWLNFNGIINCSICLYFILKRKSFSKFVDYFDKEIANYSKNDHIRKFIAKNRIITNMYFPFFFILYFTYAIYDVYIFYRESEPYDKLAFRVFRNLFRSTIHLNHLVLMQFIVESCLHVQICFKMVLDQLECLKRADGLLKIEKLQPIRQLYDIAAEKTRKLDSLLFMILCAYYCGCLQVYEINFAGLINNYSYIRLLVIVRETLILIYITFHVANINRLANGAFNKVYSISYKAHSLAIITEIRYFLIRIGRNDVGLTLLKIVLITPSFVTSILTLSLTIALSIPSIFTKT
uniref:Gustatory receptor n=1 Tax=Tetranychus urticae TaxID=32264 RepID=T1KAI7_TETUR